MIIINTSIIKFKMAESEGFEPPEPFGSTVFKTAAFNHSATPPRQPAFFTILLRQASPDLRSLAGSLCGRTGY